MIEQPQHKGQTAKSAIILTIVSILTKPLSFIREIILAAYLGTSFYKDAFVIAWAIPNVIASFVVESLNQVFVPIFVEKMQAKDEKTAWLIAGIIGNIIIVVFFLLSLVTVLAAPYIVNLIVPYAPLSTKIYATQLTRMLAFASLFLAIAALLSSILNAYRKFIIPALTFPIMNLISILFVIFFFRSWGIYALVWGTLFGTVGMVLIQLPFLIYKHRYYKFSLDVKNREVIDFGKLMTPMVLTTFIVGLMSLFEKVFASTLPVGSISSLDYAFRIINFITSIFIITISTAVFPTLSLYALDKQRSRFVNGVWNTIKAIEFTIVPIVFFLALFSHSIIKLIYERGAFTSAATDITANVTVLYGFSLLVHVPLWVLLHAFYALKDTSARLKTSALILLAYSLFNIFFIKYLGILSLPLANCIAFAVGIYFMLFWFIRQNGQEGFKALMLSLLKITFSAFLAVILIWCIWQPLKALMLVFWIKFIVMSGVFMFYILCYVCIYFMFFQDAELWTLLQHGIFTAKKEVFVIEE